MLFYVVISISFFTIVTCYKCSYNKTGYCKKETEACKHEATYCLDFHLNFKNNSQLTGKGCGLPEYCENKEEEVCESQNKTRGNTVKACGITCCKTKLCNDNFSDKASSLVFQLASWLVIFASIYLVT